MNVGEIISLFRTEVADVECPYLWTGSEVTAYLNDAYTMLVRFMGGVPDSTSAVTEISVAIGDKTAPISEAITRIVRAFRESDGAEVSVIENTDVPLVRDSAGRLSLLRVGSETGPVEYLILGSERKQVALHPVPATAETIRLQVRRNPLTKLMSDADELTDLSEEHHIHLLQWMKACAYRKQDADTLDMEKAQVNEQLFLTYCAQAAYEQERLRRKSRMSMRTERDLRNPMLMTGANPQSAGRQAPSNGG